MELWIKTSSKVGFGLVKVNDIVLYPREARYSLESKDFVLGIYDTKQRALEVLDEIQKILQPTIFIKDDEYDFVYKDNKIYKMNVEGMKNSEIQELSTYVYEMPEE